MKTLDSNDLRDIVKANMYFKKFGYPSTETAGKESSIISSVWINNSIPKIDELIFSIIFHGYLNREIAEDELWNYYIKSIYNRKFDDKGNETNSYKSLLSKLGLVISKTN